MTPAKISDIASARSKQQPTSVEGLDVTEGTALEWIEANIGPVDLPRIAVPHSRGEMVVSLKAAPLECWALVDIGRRA